MNALDEYNAQRQYQIEDAHFSEEFILDPTGSATPIEGIYDKCYMEQNRDQGNVMQQVRKPVILVNTDPGGITPRTTQITVRGSTMTIQKVDRDENGITRLWLL